MTDSIPSNPILADALKKLEWLARGVNTVHLMYSESEALWQEFQRLCAIETSPAHARLYRTLQHVSEQMRSVSPDWAGVVRWLDDALALDKPAMRLREREGDLEREIARLRTGEIPGGLLPGEFIAYRCSKCEFITLDCHEPTCEGCGRKRPLPATETIEPLPPRKRTGERPADNALSLHSPPVITEETSEQRGPFLIGDGGSHGEARFRTMKDGLPAWTLDHDEALQFVRRIDAERFCEEDEDAWQIIPVPREHR